MARICDHFSSFLFDVGDLRIDTMSRQLGTIRMVDNGWHLSAYSGAQKGFL